MPFFNEKVDITTCYMRFVKIFSFALTIAIFLLINKVTARAEMSTTISHYHKGACYENGKLTCKIKEGEITVSIAPFEMAWTNKPVELGLRFIQIGDLGLSSWPIAWNGGERAAYEPFYATKNGKYKCTVYTAGGLHGDLSVEILNIDTKVPEVHYSTAPLDWTNGNVTLSISATDALSGLAPKAYSIDGGSRFSSATSFEIKKNGSYELAVIDNAGNINKQTVSVTNIDREGPDISFFGPDKEGWINGDITLTVKAADNKSGLAKYPYSFNNGDNYTATPSLKVTNNGTYKVLVKDKLDNVSQKTIEVKCIDRDKPIISSISIDNKEWVSEGVYVEVEASDLTSGLADEAYSFDGGKTFTKSKRQLISQNATVSVVVRDKAGNTGSQTIKVSNIDSTKPQILNVSFGEKNWTKNPYEIRVEASDKDAGLAQEAYSFDGGNTFTSSPSFTVSKNGVIKLAIRDKAGNMVTREVSIENFDFDSPVISAMNLDNKNWTNGKVTISALANDSQSGLDPMAYSFNGQAYSGSNSFTMTSNGKVTLSVKDKAGNISTKTIDVTNIDKNPPTVSVGTNSLEWTNGKVVLTAGAKDGESGLSEKPYSFDGGKSFQSAGEYAVSSNGTYRVAVKDKAGNITYASIDVKNIDKTAPSLSVSNNQEGEWTNKSIRIDLKGKDTLSGLADKPYSLDGNSYTDASYFDIDENGSYSFFVKDKAGNVSKENVRITNIDKTNPTIVNITKNTDEWTEDEITITVNAGDTGSGLFGPTYSFDGGNHYVSTSFAVIKHNGDYKICVRDQAGNITEKSITIANIGKNPSDLEKERYEAEREAQEREAQKAEAEAEKRRLEEEIERKRKLLEESSSKEERVLIENQLEEIEKEYKEKSIKVIQLEEKRKIAQENASRLSQKVMEEKKSTLIGNVIETFHDESKDITPVELAEDGKYKTVSVKDYVSVESLADAGSDLAIETDEVKRQNGKWLFGGLVLLLIGIAMSLSFNYVFRIDTGKVKNPVIVKVKKDDNKIMVIVPGDKLKEEGKYMIFFSIFGRLIKKNKTVYVSVEGRDNIFTTNRGKSFEYHVE